MTDPRIEAAAKALLSFETSTPLDDVPGPVGRDVYRRATAALAAADKAATITTEWAGDHKHADIELTDEDGDPFEDAAHAISNFADYPNTIVVSRKVTPWTPVDVTR